LSNSQDKRRSSRLNVKYAIEFALYLILDSSFPMYFVFFLVLCCMNFTKAKFQSILWLLSF